MRGHTADLHGHTSHYARFLLVRSELLAILGALAAIAILTQGLNQLDIIITNRGGYPIRIKDVGVAVDDIEEPRSMGARRQFLTPAPAPSRALASGAN